jgi:hypothetical protein
MVGKMDAIETPSPRLPAHSRGADSLPIMIKPRLARQPAKSIKRIVLELTRVEIQMPSNLPTVNNPQKAEVKYAAVIVVASLSVTA